MNAHTGFLIPVFVRSELFMNMYYRVRDSGVTLDENAMYDVDRVRMQERFTFLGIPITHSFKFWDSFHV